MATVREVIGNGSWFGITLLEKITEGGWYIPNGLLLLPPSSFFVIAGFIAIIRLWKKTSKKLLNLS